MAISDALLRQSISVLAYGMWPLGNFICQFQGFSVVSFACASLLIMTVTAINRYFRVVRTIPCDRKKVRISSWKILLLSESELTPCGLFLYVYVCVPMAIISYYQIFRTIRRHKKRISAIRQGNDLGSNVEDIKVTRTLCLTVLGFLCCWTPIMVFDLIDLVRGSSTLPREVYVFYTFLGNISASINPFIYGVTNTTFSEEYKKILRIKGAHRTKTAQASLIVQRVIAQKDNKSLTEQVSTKHRLAHWCD
ncbi:5-hydroxytryptamine receptor 4-like [Nematostella vectensis]|uniref:5-hydroxytryptamine receptor 4-like n=1 Tax=Nematostella vectensis TaxID=45351 RepID=UPI00207793FD|nr:5-hydroxytryptamine receptor 4-like [Nematostella vectensis]